MTRKDIKSRDFCINYVTSLPPSEIPNYSRAEANKLVALYRFHYHNTVNHLDHMRRLDPIPAEPCSWHKRGDRDYVTWHNWAFLQSSFGRKQRQCPDCRRYFFKSEWGKKP